MKAGLYCRNQPRESPRYDDVETLTAYKKNPEELLKGYSKLFSDFALCISILQRKLKDERCFLELLFTSFLHGFTGFLEEHERKIRLNKEKANQRKSRRRNAEMKN